MAAGDTGVGSRPTTLVERLHTDATRLTRLYGVARPDARPRRRALQQAFHAAFQEATGKVYQAYGGTKTARERTAITAFWDETLRTALARFEATGEVETLDEVMACLPGWADRRYERWSAQGWREPSPTQVMQHLTTYLHVCEVCRGPLAVLARAALAQAPVADSAAVTRAVAPPHAEEIATLQAQLSALSRPKDVPKAQHAALRQEKAALQRALGAAQSAQEAAITRAVKRRATVRQQLDALVKTASGYPDTLVRQVGKASVDVFPHLLWIYDFDRRGEDTWRTAKRDARRFVRQVREGHGTSGKGP